MNPKIFYIAFLFTILAGCISSSSLSDNRNSVVNDNSSDKGPTLMQILQSILKDPEYLALSDYEQLKVLEAIYTILESSYNSQQNSKSKYQNKSPFANFL